MPKVSRSTGKVGSKAKAIQKGLLLYTYGTKRVLGRRHECYDEAISSCRTMFPDLIRGRKISLHTDELSICGSESAEISPESWGAVVTEVNTIDVRSEELPLALTNGQQLQPGFCRATQVSESSRRTTTPKILNLRFTLGLEQTISVRVRSQGRVENTFRLVVGKFGKDFDAIRFCDSTLERIGFNSYTTFDQLSIEDEDTIFLTIAQVGGKPVIYLLSPNTIEATVRLSLVKEWSLSAIYPIVPIHESIARSRESLVWRVRVHPTGELTELTTGLDVAYLFWEAHTNPCRLESPPPSPNQTTQRKTVETFDPSNASLNENNAVVLPLANITPYLDMTLKGLGLLTEARTSFITYWLPSLLKHQNVALRFVPQEAYEQAAPLDISPPPDVVTRVFIIFQGVSDNDLCKWDIARARANEDVKHWITTVGVDVNRTLDARLFRVIEWGGMEVIRSA